MIEIEWITRCTCDYCENEIPEEVDHVHITGDDHEVFVNGELYKQLDFCNKQCFKNWIDEQL